jgi:uncharacterized protein YkwD
MGNHLPTVLIIIICIFLTAHIQPAYAQEQKKNSGYINIVKSLIITQSSTADSKQIKGKQTQSIPKATPTIYIAPSPTPSPIATPTAIAKRKPILKPTSEPQIPTGNEIAFIMEEINKYRSAHGLGFVQTNGETCSFAATRAAEIVANFSHDGFQSRIDNKTLPFTWSSVTENIAMTTDYKEVVKMWENSPGHAVNMRADTPFVCVRQSGNYFAYVGMKP